VRAALFGGTGRGRENCSFRRSSLPGRPGPPASLRPQRSCRQAGRAVDGSSLATLESDRVDSSCSMGPPGARPWPRRLGGVGSHGSEQRAGRTRAIGLSNVSAGQLEEIWTRSTVKPTTCRTGPSRGRKPMAPHGILLASRDALRGVLAAHQANPAALRHPTVRKIAEKHSKTPEQVVLRYAVQAGIVPLTGTTSRKHMEDDLDVAKFSLDAARPRRWKLFSTDAPRAWNEGSSARAPTPRVLTLGRAIAHETGKTAGPCLESGTMGPRRAWPTADARAP